MPQPGKINDKGLITVIRISKEEAATLRREIPGVCVTVVNRQTSHKRYYAEETRKVLSVVGRLRGEAGGGKSFRKARA